MNFKKISIKIILLAFCLILFFNNKVSADSPSIKIYLKNMNTTDYTIDLLVEEKSNAGINYNTKCRYTEYENTPIYNYNENGWIAATLRHGLILGNIKGNEKKEHSFNYLAV